MSSPFEVLGLEPTMDLARDALELRYHELSRVCHPDFNPVDDENERAAVLARAAELNDAFHKLADPWDRAACLIELRDPGAVERTKNLDPAFLMDALETAEQVAEVQDERRAELAARLTAQTADYLRRITAEIEAGHAERAAVLLHEARYSKKALTDLERPETLL